MVLTKKFYADVVDKDTIMLYLDSKNGDIIGCYKTNEEAINELITCFLSEVQHYYFTALIHKELTAMRECKNTIVCELTLPDAMSKSLIDDPKNIVKALEEYLEVPAVECTFECRSTYHRKSYRDWNRITHKDSYKISFSIPLYKISQEVYEKKLRNADEFRYSNGGIKYEQHDTLFD